MAPPDLKNPFSAHKSDDTLSLPPGDVPDLHAEVVNTCLDAIPQAVATHQSIGVTVVGEAGSGKSHLLARVRTRLAGRRGTAFAAIRLAGAFAGRIWRPVQRQLVEELLRPLGAADAPNGLARILRNRFPAWAERAGDPRRWPAGRLPPGELRAHLEEFDPGGTLDHRFFTVLLRLGDAATSRAALAWLRGAPLGDEDLTRLGLPRAATTDQEQEAQAAEVVRSLLHLAGGSTALMMCFDEIEAIQAGAADAAALVQLSAMLTALLAQEGPRVVVTSIRPNLFTTLRKTVELSNVQKFAQIISLIPPVTAGQARQVVRSRLAAEPSVVAGREKAGADVDWPLGAAHLSGLIDGQRSLTPRHLIMSCHSAFERIRQGKPPENERPAGPGAGPGKSPPPPDFSAAWQRRRDRILADPSGTDFDKVMATVLPWLARLTRVPVEQAPNPPTFGDVNLFYRPRGKANGRIGVSLCNHHPAQLWRRLDRLMVQWRTGRSREPMRLVVLRSAAERTTEAADMRLIALREAGVETPDVPTPLLAELAAYQGLLAAAQEGDLVLRDGRTVEASSYERWVGANLSDPVRGFLCAVFGEGKSGEPPQSGG